MQYKAVIVSTQSYSDLFDVWLLQAYFNEGWKIESVIAGNPAIGTSSYVNYCATWFVVLVR